LEPTATSHFEKLNRSRCRQASGEKLWCGTCHEAHTDSTPAHYNQQCQSCHAEKKCTGSQSQNCIDCHMPKRAAARSVEHLAFTDHAIPRRPTPPSTQTAQSLREFWTGQSNPRDTALAYAAANLDSAYPLLEEAAKANPKDIPLLLQLALYHERGNAEEKAEKLYGQILQIDPANTTAAVNVGTYRIRQGSAKEAMALWLQALARNPALISARLNLAVAQYQSGNSAAAKASLKTVLDYEPAHPAALRMLAQIP
jgi:tetratricopeptide (TPR) repeat protein